ncbi:MAG: shikimate dehydrogenase [Nitrospirae bacterium]|nr:shikimate dehydrogenase [Nitrospirota bacterium]MBI3606232.1 shikimate dehydrogenase [Nitrospirota bacterium]
MTGKTRGVAIIGHPVSHSLSPQMHQAAFDALELDYCYLPFDLFPKDLKKGVLALKLLGFRGFNVTVPHKTKIVPLLDQISREASLIGAVNTVLIEKGKLKGFNTDGPGFIESLKREWHYSVHKKHVVILGAGGAAKAVAAQICLEKAASLGIVNRTVSKGEMLKKQLQKSFPSIKIAAFPSKGEALKDFIRQSDLLINATSLGLHPGDPSPCPPDYFFKGLKVVDLIYNPPMTAFLRGAGKKGCQTLNGLSMLLYQGALAFKIWTGEMPPVRLMAGTLR